MLELKWTVIFMMILLIGVAIHNLVWPLNGIGYPLAAGIHCGVRYWQEVHGKVG